MGNRFLRVMRNQARNAKSSELPAAKPYSKMTHQEYVTEVRALMDDLGVERLPAHHLTVFVQINKVA